MPSHPVRQFEELRTWLAASGESARAFSLRSGIDKSTFGRLLNGQVSQFSLALIAKIKKATNDEIGHEQFAAFGKRMAETPLPPSRRRKPVRRAA